MARYQCSVCGYVFDEGAEGRRWDDLPADWQCPVCGATRTQFRSEQGAPSPSRLILAHRAFGYVFLAVYVLLVVQMAPRLWTYQIEFPARTVLHIALGMVVGVLLLLKIAIARFFRRLDQPLLPQLGTAILVASVVLIGISIPAAFQEAAATARLFSDDNRDRVRLLLAQTGLDEANCVRLASADSLRAGQRVLRRDCIGCHDLRTVLARPRTPNAWRQTVRRMADRTTLVRPLEEEAQWQVTAYLVALSPQLQRSAQELRDAQQRREQSKKAAETVASKGVDLPAYDPVGAKRLFESKCSQCHKTNLLDIAPPGSEEEARQLVADMVDEGLEASLDELALLVRYLTETYASPPE